MNTFQIWAASRVSVLENATFGPPPLPINFVDDLDFNYFQQKIFILVLFQG